MPSIVSPRLEMIAHHYGVEAGFLRGHREFQKIARARTARPMLCSLFSALRFPPWVDYVAF